MNFGTIIAADAQRLMESRPNVFRILKAAVGEPGFLAVCLLRVQGAFLRRRLRVLARIVHSLNLSLTGADFCVGCEIGEGVFIPHPNGIVIGQEAVIGKRCTVLQQVTLGVRHAGGVDVPQEFPIVMDDVVIGAGAKLLGKIRVGNRAVIGANAVVLTDVPDGAVAAGVPARIVSSQPPLAMTGSGS